MEAVLFHHFIPQWLKGPQADMQRDLGGLNAARADLLQDLRREVQAGGGRGDRAPRLFAGKDGLVARAVVGRVRPVDVRRQRDVPDALDDGEEVRHRSKAQRPLAEGAAGDDFGLEQRRRARLRTLLRGKEQAFAHADLASGMHQRQPFVRCELAREQDFHLAPQVLAGRGVLRADRLGMDAGAMSVKPRRKDAGVVEDQQVVRAEQRGQLPEVAVGEAAG